MNKLPTPATGAMQARFAPVPTQLRAPGEGAPALAAPPPPVSPELLDLLTPEMQLHKALHEAVLRLRLENTVRKARSASPGEAERSTGLRGVTTFAYVGQDQSSQQEGGDQESGQRGQTPLQHTSDGDRQGASAKERALASVATHMALSAAGLPRRCEAEHAARGNGAMLAWLHGELRPLLVGCVRDLAQKVEWLAAQQSQAGRGADAIRPVAEICAALLDVLRPLYGFYALGPQLLQDVRGVLCGAQELLAAEVRVHAEASPLFARLMVDTVQPLFAIILLGAMPRPRQLPVAGVALEHSA